MILLVAFLRRAIFGSCVCATKLYVRAVPASSYFYSMHVSVVATCVPAGVFITFSHVLMFLALDELEPVPLFLTLVVLVCLGVEPVPPRRLCPAGLFDLSGRVFSTPPLRPRSLRLVPTPVRWM
jgi:hypothetical protein